MKTLVWKYYILIQVLKIGIIHIASAYMNIFWKNTIETHRSNGETNSSLPTSKHRLLHFTDQHIRHLQGLKFPASKKLRKRKHLRGNLQKTHLYNQIQGDFKENICSENDAFFGTEFFPRNLSQQQLQLPTSTMGIVLKACIAACCTPMTLMTGHAEQNPSSFPMGLMGRWCQCQVVDSVTKLGRLRNRSENWSESNLVTSSHMLNMNNKLKPIYSTSFLFPSKSFSKNHLWDPWLLPCYRPVSQTKERDTPGPTGEVMDRDRCHAMSHPASEPCDHCDHWRPGQAVQNRSRGSFLA